MGDENPDFKPKAGDSVWYDHNDDWVEATVVKVKAGGKYLLDVDGVGQKDNVPKSDMMPVEYEEDGDDAEEGEVEEPAAEEEEEARDGRNTVSFPAGPLGIDINQVNGRIVVTSSKGNALEQGVLVGDVLVRVGDVELGPKLRDVPDDKKCAEVKKIVVSFPRPLNMVFIRDEAEDESVASSKASTKKGGIMGALFGKKGKSAPEEEEITATFAAGSLGLSVTNDPKRGQALVVTKATGQAETNGVMVGDEILSLNGEVCRGFKSEEFKKLIVAAGRPFDLTVVRVAEAGGDGGNSAAAAAAAAAEKKRLEDEKAAEKKAIEEAKAKAKKMQEDKKKKAAEEEKKKAAEEEKKKAEAEAQAAKGGGKKGAEEAKEYKKGQEVWYDNGEDWVEATIVKLGELLTLELRDTGDRVEKVEREWISPMEYEDEDKNGDSKTDDAEEEEAAEEDDPMAALAGMAADSSMSSAKSSSVSGAGGLGQSGKATAAAKAKEAKAKAASEAAAKAKRGGIMGKVAGKMAGGFAGHKSHMSKFAVEVDTEVASDSLHRARTARMSYAAMITYAAFHAGNKEEKPVTPLVAKVKKARSKSIEKRGPQIQDGESHYQYLMRKKREAAYDEELKKEEAREEQARAREEKMLADMEYRQRLNDEYLENQLPRGDDDE